MSFKEFMSSHPGRRFLDNFCQMSQALKDLADTTKKMMKDQEDIRHRLTEEVPMVAAVAPVEMPCFACGAEVMVGTAVAVTYQGATGVLCVNCATEKELIHGVTAN
jgi:hypothetical protein